GDASPAQRGCVMQVAAAERPSMTRTFLYYLLRSRDLRACTRLAASCERRHRDLRNLSGRPSDAYALAFERLGLRLSASGAAGHDRSGVTHGLAGRRREAGDVADDWLRNGLGDVFGGALLGVAADLARDHDQLGLRIGL